MVGLCNIWNRCSHIFVTALDVGLCCRKPLVDSIIWFWNDLGTLDLPVLNYESTKAGYPCRTRESIGTSLLYKLLF